jgi:hypothetical protein
MGMAPEQKADVFAKAQAIGNVAKLVAGVVLSSSASSSLAPRISPSMIGRGLVQEDRVVCLRQDVWSAVRAHQQVGLRLETNLVKLVAAFLVFAFIFYAVVCSK